MCQWCPERDRTCTAKRQDALQDCTLRKFGSAGSFLKGEAALEHVTFVTGGVSETREEGEELLAGLCVRVLAEDDLHQRFLRARREKPTSAFARGYLGRVEDTYAGNLVGHEPLGDSVSVRDFQKRVKKKSRLGIVGRDHEGAPGQKSPYTGWKIMSSAMPACGQKGASARLSGRRVEAARRERRDRRTGSP